MPSPVFTRLIAYALVDDAGNHARLHSSHHPDFGWVYQLCRNPEEPIFQVDHPDALKPILMEDAFAPNTSPTRPSWGTFATRRAGGDTALAEPLYPVKLVTETRTELLALDLPPRVETLDTVDGERAAALIDRLGLEPADRQTLVITAKDRPDDGFRALLGQRICCGSYAHQRTVRAVEVLADRVHLVCSESD